MSAIDEVKEKTDIVEIIGQHTKLTKSGRNFRGLCPFHSENRPSFFVYPEQQSWHCFGACSTGGDAFSFLMKKEGIDFGEALRLLAERTGVTLPSRSVKDTGKDKNEGLFKITEVAAQYFHNLLLNSPSAAKARDYVTGRGISPKTVTDFQLGFSLESWEALKQYLLEKGYQENELLEAGLIIATEEGRTYDRFRNRLMFPISDARGHITGFGARALDDSLPKYLNSPQTPLFDKSATIYGINLATTAIRQQNAVVIVEGYMDAMTAHQNDFTNVVAAMGTAVTEKQLSTLKRLSKNMVLALDADTAGEEAMLRCVDYENSLDTEIKVAILPSGRDPDDVIREDTKTWQHLLDEALPVVDYTINMVTARLDLSTAIDKSLARDRLLTIIAEIKDSTRRDHYLNRLSELIGTSYRNLEDDVSRILSTRKNKKQKPETLKRAVPSPLSSPLEEYCLALLLQHPILKKQTVDLLPEYFENSANREIFIAWQQADDPGLLKDRLDATLWEHLDALANREILASQLELKYADCTRNLRRKYLQKLEAQRAEIFALEVESGGSGADLAKLQAEGTDPAVQLRELDRVKNKSGAETRR
ncbi:DNA primase [Chloroflexota bacterium]